MIRRALPASVALHLLALAMLLPRPDGGGGAPPAEEPPVIEVEMVQQPDAVQGTPATAPGEQEAQAPSPPTDPAPPPPQAGPDPAAPPQPPPAAPASPHFAAVNLGGADRDLEALSVTGEHVVPPRPDAVFRNRPPAYPRDAGRRGAHGTVGLLVRISAEGAAESVVVASSSGTASLDQAARDAVLLWHFTPALAGGLPVPYEYRLDIRFVTGGR